MSADLNLHFEENRKLPLVYTREHGILCLHSSSFHVQLNEITVSID